MKNTTLFFRTLVGMLFLTATTLSAQNGLTLPQKQMGSSETKYKADKLPSEYSWKELILDKNVNALAGEVTTKVEQNLLKVSSTNTADQYSQIGWYQANPGFDPATGYTVEIKAKVNKAPQYGAFNIQGMDKSGKGFRLGIYDSYLANQTNPFLATDTLKTGSNKSSLTYRVAVTKEGKAYVYRDNVHIGSFDTEGYRMDNIIANGGFEDFTKADENTGRNPEYYIANGWSTTGGLFEREWIDAFTGEFCAWAESGKGQDVSPGVTTVGYPSYRPIPLKPNADYQVSAAIRRVSAFGDNPWRDFDVWYNGVGTANAGTRAIHHIIYKNHLTFAQWSWTAKGSNTNKSLIINIPCLTNEDFSSTVLFDDVNVQEVIAIDTPGGNAQLTNLFTNGGFEDTTGWATGDSGNEPANQMDEWGCKLRIQTGAKADDVDEWAHSGTKSLRFCTFNGAENLNFKRTLTADKSYEFSLWIKTAKYEDPACQFTIAIGDEVLFTEALTRNTEWRQIKVNFSTTEAKKELRIYTVNGGWFNMYIDDIELYQHEGDMRKSFVFFGKSTGVDPMDVEIESVAYDLTGAYAPVGVVSGNDEIVVSSVTAYAVNDVLTIEGADANASIAVYNLSGILVQQTQETTIQLPAKGIYIVKVDGESIKVINQ